MDETGELSPAQRGESERGRRGQRWRQPSGVTFSLRTLELEADREPSASQAGVLSRKTAALCKRRQEVAERLLPTPPHLIKTAT